MPKTQNKDNAPFQSKNPPAQSPHRKPCFAITLRHAGFALSVPPAQSPARTTVPPSHYGMQDLPDLSRPHKAHHEQPFRHHTTARPPRAPSTLRFQNKKTANDSICFAPICRQTFALPLHVLDKTKVPFGMPTRSYNI